MQGQAVPGNQSVSATFWSRNRGHRLLVAIFLILLTFCILDLAYLHHDWLSRVVAGISITLLSIAAYGVWVERKHYAARQFELQHEADQNRRIFETCLDLILVSDRKGVFTRVSPSSLRILGYRPEEMIGRNALEFLNPDDVEGTRNEIRLARRGRTRRNFESRFRHKDGHFVSMNWTGVWSDPDAEYFSIGRDMTARKALERRERESKETLAAVINASPVGILCLAPDRTVLVWSRAAEQIFGYTADEVVGRPYALVPEGHEAEFNTLIARSMGGETLRDIRVRRQRKDGSLVDISFEAAPMYDDMGGVTSVAFALTDITDRNKLEQRLRQSEKMDVIGQLTGGVAHDFNNMLTVITGTIDLLAEGVADRPELAVIAKLISEAADRGAELTRHLLAFARKQPLRPRLTNVTHVAQEAANLLRQTLGEQINIDWKLSDRAWSAMVDPGQLVTAIVNLAVNARDVMPDGGKLTIETKNVFLDEAYADEHSEVVSGAYVMIAVSDTGPGIPMAIRDKVFEPFFTTKDVGKGTGLGLSMVYGFVKQSGGHIKLYSEEGYGTTFKIYLPRAGCSLIDAADMSAMPLVGGNETILVVEDDPIVRVSVTTQLKSMGYQVMTAENGLDALAVINEGAAFDLLFTDVVMPGSMNGRALVEEVRKKRPSIKVLFTSGYTQDAIVHHGRLDPDVLLLAKPYRKTDLAQMIRKAIAA
ncbi:hybrid sensor histidine kinase/response regulator [Pseudorhodoplanes sinuspersici]|uniref:histidine kinase n=1 Tax=Pseudorhodoplanes sinuspersici TaxID=1235591 RepID=A0A1W6ZV78_9HYPH|nr:PAS domain-containing sensor histidine kinase [Pseudorhodoplanes sinuspersici]ARQ01230.1 hypothetical protein CAK95_20625 [Pseudorhodoplanes sinuspersici]RKE72900.1 PAS domain S-box-containing protein [Pseudorhodoplanes sinuspersici]